MFTRDTGLKTIVSAEYLAAEYARAARFVNFGQRSVRITRVALDRSVRMRLCVCFFWRSFSHRSSCDPLGAAKQARKSRVEVFLSARFHFHTIFGENRFRRLLV